MKYCLSASVQIEPMDDAEVFARVAAFEQVHDALENGCDATALEVCENLQELKDRITAKDKTVNAFISSQPELVDMLQQEKSVENFMARLDRELLAAQEGMGADLWYGELIGAFLHRKDTLLSHLKPLIPQLIKQVSEADEKKFGQWKVFRQINVFSKYLPDQNQYDKCVAALKAAAAYLASVDPNKFDQNKFNGFFTGSVYAKKKGGVSSSTLVGAAWYGTRDIRIRGWTEKQHFLSALKQMNELIASMEALSSALEKNKSVKIDDATKANAKACGSAIATTLNLIGHLGRGITAAASKISGSIWKRLFTTEH